MNKGSVYYFNPTCELAVANGLFSYMPPLLLQEMERDLAILPFIFCSENDFVLTENLPSTTFQDNLRNLGFELPSFKSIAELESMPTAAFDSIIPWGWSPAAHYKLRNLKDKCSQEFRKSPMFEWNNEHKLLYERSTSLNLLHQILKNNPPHWFIDPNRCGVIAKNFDEIDSMLKKHSSLVLKAPISSSGRGIQIIRRPSLNASNKQWISGVFKQQNYLIAEPYLEKLVDLSFQFEVKNNSEVFYHGISVFETNSNGQYKGTLIHPDLSSIFQRDAIFEVKEKIEITADILRHVLYESDILHNYRGYLGIDALFYRDQNKLMIHPCLELNCRMNMGILCLFLEKKMDQNTRGKFEISPIKKNEFQILNEDISDANKIIFMDRKTYSGHLPLTESNKNSRFEAYLSLGSAR